LCAELEREGALDEAVATAADLTRDALAHLISEKGMPYDQAWELVREEWGFVEGEQLATSSTQQSPTSRPLSGRA
jgi:hypothetical protein